MFVGAVAQTPTCYSLVSLILKSRKRWCWALVNCLYCMAPCAGFSSDLHLHSQLTHLGPPPVPARRVSPPVLHTASLDAANSSQRPLRPFCCSRHVPLTLEHLASSTARVVPSLRSVLYVDGHELFWHLPHTAMSFGSCLCRCSFHASSLFNAQLCSETKLWKRGLVP